MKFKGSEIIAIMHIALNIAKIDGEFADKESSAIAEELVKFNIPGKDAYLIMRQANTIDDETAIATISAMNNEQKKFVNGFWGWIIASDGHFHNSELDILSKLSLQCKFPPMHIFDAIQYWNEH